MGQVGLNRINKPSPVLRESQVCARCEGHEEGNGQGQGNKGLLQRNNKARGELVNRIRPRPISPPPPPPTLTYTVRPSGIVVHACFFLFFFGPALENWRVELSVFACRLSLGVRACVSICVCVIGSEGGGRGGVRVS